MIHRQTLSFLRTVVMIGIYGGLLMPLMFIPIVIFPFVFSKLIFFQIIIGLTFPAYVMLAWIEPAYRPKYHLLYAALSAYFVALFLSVIFAVDPFRAWWGNQERMNGLFTLLHIFLWLTMTVSTLKNWDQWRKLLHYEVALSAIMGIVALWQKINPKLLLFEAGPRVGGLLDNPIYMGAYQIFNLFFLALLFLKVRTRTAWTWYAVIAVIDVMAFIAAQSRGAFIGLSVGVLAFLAYYGWFSPSKKARTIVAVVLGLCFIGYGFLYMNRNVPIIRNSPLYRITDFSGSISTRFIAWKIAWNGFLDRPITGWGLDNFHIIFNTKYNPHSLRFGAYETWFDRAHNTILDVLSMTGLLGFITFAGIFIAIFFVSWQAFRKGWIDLSVSAVLFALPIGYFVQNLFVFDHPAAFSMSYLLFAFVIAATRGDFISQSQSQVDSASYSERFFSWTSFGMLQLAALLLVWRTSILPFQASRLSILANQYFATESVPVGYQLASAASSIWTPYLDEQTFLVSKNMITMAPNGGIQKLPKWQEMYALAKKITEEELRRHPRNTHTHYIYARLAQEMSTYFPEDKKLSEDQYRAALETSPKRQQLFYGLGRLYLTQGRMEEALNLYRHVRDFDSDLGEGHWMYGVSLLYDKQDLQNGAKEIVESQRVPYRYRLREPREFIPLSDAYQVLNDKDGMKKMVELLPLVPADRNQIQAYVEWAVRLQNMQLFVERDQVLAYAENISFEPGQTKPNVHIMFESRLRGKPPVTSQAPAMLEPISAVVATRTRTGPGPRK